MDLVEQIGAARAAEQRGRNRVRSYLALAALLFAAGFLLTGLGLRQSDSAWLKFGPAYATVAITLMGLVVGYYFGRQDAPEPVGLETVHTALRLYSEASRMQADAAQEHALYLRRRLDLEADAEADREP